MKMFYSSFVESILTFAIICWFGRLESTVKKSQKITSFNLDEFIIVILLSLFFLSSIECGL